jgi:hypothetical protein
MKRLSLSAVALAVALFASSGRPAGAAVVGVPSVTTVSAGGMASVPVTLTTASGEDIAFRSFQVNITFDPTKFAINAATIILNPTLAAAGFTGTSAIIGGNDFRVTYSKIGFPFSEVGGTVLNLFSFNLTALPGTVPGDYVNGLLIAPAGNTATDTSVGANSNSTTNSFVTGTSSGLIRVTAVPEPSQIAFLGLLGGLGAFKGVSVLNRRRHASV